MATPMLVDDTPPVSPEPPDEDPAEAVALELEVDEAELCVLVVPDASARRACQANQSMFHRYLF